jgi:hypothetical protein
MTKSYSGRNGNIQNAGKPQYERSRWRDTGKKSIYIFGGTRVGNRRECLENEKYQAQYQIQLPTLSLFFTITFLLFFILMTWVLCLHGYSLIERMPRIMMSHDY